jgi:hypothetical protein
VAPRAPLAPFVDTPPPHHDGEDSQGTQPEQSAALPRAPPLYIEDDGVAAAVQPQCKAAGVDAVASAAARGAGAGGPAVHACIFCLGWVKTHLSGMEFHVVVAEEYADDLMATELSESMLCTDEKKSTPELVVLKTSDVRFIVSNEYEFMDYKEVVAEFKRTPKSMRMKPVKVTGRSGAESVAYLVPDPKKRRLRIETIEGVRCEDHVLVPHARAFSSQGKRILDHLAKTMLTNANMTNLDRLPSKVALQQRVGQASTPSTSCASIAPRRKGSSPRERSW